MRTFPKNIEDLVYLISKVGFSPIRGIFVWIFMSKGSGIPFVGHGVKIVSTRMITCGKLVWIGQYCYIDAHSEAGIKLGSGVTLREGGTIQCRSGLNLPGEGLIIEEGTFIGPNFKIGVGGLIKIGKNCQFGAYCSLNAESHILSKDGTYTGGGIRRKGIEIGDNVWIGDGVVILDGVKVGSDSVIGAGSIVVGDVQSQTVVAGSPARLLRKIEKKGEI